MRIEQLAPGNRDKTAGLLSLSPSAERLPAVVVYCEHRFLVLDLIQATLRFNPREGDEQHFGSLTDDDVEPRFATAGNLVDIVTGRAENRSRGTWEFASSNFRLPATSAAPGGRPTEID